jgi:hypothetical protein
MNQSIKHVDKVTGQKLPAIQHSSRSLKLLGAIAALLATLLIPMAPAHASGLLISKGGFGGRLEIKEQDIRVTINNGIAITEVNQVFLNTESRIVEALYVFPVPNGASVSNFSMIIAGKEMIGEVVEKQRAREIYESYKRTKKDPGLLEQVDYKMFEMRVFPIQPNAEQHIKVTYYQPLDFDHDTATYVYPLATSTQGVDERTTGKFAMTLDIKSEIPVSEIKSPSHRNEFVVVNHSAEYSRASMEVNAGDLSRDVVVTFQTKRPKTGLDLIASKHPGEDGYFMMSLTAGEELELPELDNANPEIDRMWAWYQVQTRMNQKRKTGETTELKDEIVSLCEGYSIVSEYASFIVLENDAEYRRWKIQRRNATRIQRDRAARELVQQQLAELRDKSMSELGPAEKSNSQATPNKKEPGNSQRRPAPTVTNHRGRDLEFTSQPTSTPQSNNTQGRRRSSGGGGGGGAIDPITGLIAASMAGAAALRRRKAKAKSISQSAPGVSEVEV